MNEYMNEKDLNIKDPSISIDELRDGDYAMHHL
jgi:hypothetical protein